MSNKNEIVNVNGLEIKNNSIYKIINKSDSSAPSGFIKAGTTKLPSLGIGNSVPCRFVIRNKVTNEGLYDTGFYTGSPCYVGMDEPKVKAMVHMLNEKIVKPYEELHEKGDLSHKNEKFWGSFSILLTDGKYFVTNKPDDLLELYIALRSCELTPKGKQFEGNPKFKDSQYCVEDKEKVKNIEDERADNLMTCLTNFGILLATDKSLLINILKYVQFVGFNIQVNPDTLQSSFYQWINKKDANVEKFKTAFDLADNEETKEIINLYVVVNKLAKTGVLKKQGAQYTYRNEPLGADLKTVAKNLNHIKDFEDIKIELLELE